MADLGKMHGRKFVPDSRLMLGEGKFGVLTDCQILHCTVDNEVSLHINGIIKFS